MVYSRRRSRLLLESVIEHVDIRWLVFLVYQRFEFANYRVNGHFYYKENGGQSPNSPVIRSRLVVDNVIVLKETEFAHEGGFVAEPRIIQTWNPRIVTAQLKTISLKAFNDIIEQKGFRGWRISTEFNGKSTINPKNRTIYIKETELYGYTKKYGIQRFIENLKSKLSKQGASARDSQSESSSHAEGFASPSTNRRPTLVTFFDLKKSRRGG